ncbi:hypothetical protein JVT61DRAFT_1069 [Boletus reticuloceps]|uniref:Gelsolin n=1 Tax=Boletus reticuloceps TaxID=495285 RepID=A0A8I2YU19_9AGAM|nr:hypothetical protein JVT61DRAFT_1069 [Boletus reticuloceps]
MIGTGISTMKMHMSYCIKAPFSRDIYYWIGQNATQDNTVTAAFKSIEPDEHLGKLKVSQYREAQEEAGLRSGTTLVSSRPRIHKEFCQFNEKGKQTISYEMISIEQGGIYVYDSSDKIALLCTRASLAWERFWVGEMVMHIGGNVAEYLAHILRAYIDEGTPGDTEFMTLVGVDNVTPLHSRVYDSDHSVGPPAQLYRLGWAVYRFACCLVTSSLTLDAFDSEGVYILDDHGNTHDPVVYVWVGKDVPDAKARTALANGEVYLKENRELGRGNGFRCR